MTHLFLIRSVLLISITVLLMVQCIPDIPDDTAPVVNIIYPVDGQVVSGTVSVTVGASDENELRQIDLFIDGERVSTGRGPLLEYTWDTAPIADDRNHSLYATATDADNNNGFSGTVNVRVASGQYPDTLAPEIAILYPVTGTTVFGTVSVVVQVSDDSPIDRVEYFVDGLLTYSALQQPYSYQWDVSGFGTGTTHHLFARAYDINLNSSVSNNVSVTIADTDVTPPAISILHPVTGATVSDTVDVVVQVFDQSPIDRIEYYVDGLLHFTTTQAPYTYRWDVTGYPDGSAHNLFARAYDIYLNNSVSTNISVTVTNVDIIPPTVTIIHPAAGTIFTAGTIVRVAADAQDNIGIQRVEFYIDGELKRTDLASPYDYSWDTTLYGDGRLHTIYVKAFDLAGNSAAELISVTVNP